MIIWFFFYENKTQRIEILDDEKEMIQNDFQNVWNLPSKLQWMKLMQNDVKWFKIDVKWFNIDVKWFKNDVIVKWFKMTWIDTKWHHSTSFGFQNDCNEQMAKNRDESDETQTEYYDSSRNDLVVKKKSDFDKISFFWRLASFIWKRLGKYRIIADGSRGLLENWKVGTYISKLNKYRTLELLYFFSKRSLSFVV